MNEYLLTTNKEYNKNPDGCQHTFFNIYIWMPEGTLQQPISISKFQFRHQMNQQLTNYTWNPANTQTSNNSTTIQQ